jgi:hypothetical protein
MKENFSGVAEMKFTRPKVKYTWKASERNRHILKELNTELILNRNIK